MLLARAARNATLRQTGRKNPRRGGRWTTAQQEHPTTNIHFHPKIRELFLLPRVVTGDQHSVKNRVGEGFSGIGRLNKTSGHCRNDSWKKANSIAQCTCLYRKASFHCLQAA
jgi:hypothetical protein